MNGQLKTAAETKTFVLAGNATLTLVSRMSGNRFTFKIRKPSAEKPHFVKLLRGTDNESDFTFLGTIFPTGEYRHGMRSSIGAEADSAKAFEWFWRQVSKGELPPTLEVWHEGRCGRCGRKLTVPTSIASGMGPECAGRV